MEEKEYIAIIESQKKTIEKLTKELDECQNNLNLVLDKYSKLKEEKGYFMEEEPEKEDPGDYLSIEDLGLSTRASNCLRRAGVNCVNDIFRMVPTKDDLKNVRNLGAKSAKEVIRAFEDAGFDMSRYK